MSPILLIDTTIFCEILEVPGKCQNPEQVMNALAEYINNDAILLLPIATILETGNHIAQVSDGQVRRRKAQLFVRMVRQGIQRKAPWVISDPLLNREMLDRYLDEFPNTAMTGCGFGDLTIIHEFHKQCQLNPAREVLIWSKDHHLKAYHQAPPPWVGN
jgi:hypothetical protein